ncbi:MAG: hypothetical protein ACLQCU_01725 [Acidimicrobiales bacterium]|jgi:hypothetical protein
MLIPKAALDAFVGTSTAGSLFASGSSPSPHYLVLAVLAVGAGHCGLSQPLRAFTATAGSSSRSVGFVEFVVADIPRDDAL